MEPKKSAPTRTMLMSRFLSRHFNAILRDSLYREIQIRLGIDTAAIKQAIRDGLQNDP